MQKTGSSFAACVRLGVLFALIVCGHSSRLSTDTIELKIIHTASPGSPYWKEHHYDKAELLKELLRADATRLQRFRRVLRDGESTANALTGQFTALQEEKVVQMRNLSDGTSLETRLVSGSFVGSGQYFVDFYLGTPPRKFPLIVDTGSDLTWVQCRDASFPSSSSSSNSSLLNHSSFEPKNSSSFVPISCSSEECFKVPGPENSSCTAASAAAGKSTCDYDYRYVDQSKSSGILAYETVSLNSSSTKMISIDNVTIGCGINTQGTSFMGSSGVLGLGRGPVSFATQLGLKFSYCLVNFLTFGNASSSLLFGENSQQKKKKKRFYTPFHRNPADTFSYYLGIQRLLFEEKPLDIHYATWAVDEEGNGGSIIDSGSTLSYFRQPAYTTLLHSFKRSKRVRQYERIKNSMASFGLELCFNVSNLPKHRMRFPRFEIEFDGGALMRPPAENYLVELAHGVRCLAILPAGPLSSNVIGNLLQQNYNVEYDRQRSRLGFMWSPCS